jgi:hypothetical protein
MMQRDQLVLVAVDEQDRALWVRAHDVDWAHLIAVETEDDLRKKEDSRREPRRNPGDALEVLADDRGGVRVRGVGDNGADIRMKEKRL